MTVGLSATHGDSVWNLMSNTLTIEFSPCDLNPPNWWVRFIGT